MNGWVNQSMFDGQVFAQLVIDDAISKKSHKVDARLNYATIVSEIARWLTDWLSTEIPKPSELVALLTDAFLMVMKAKRKPLTMENYAIFINALNADVIKELAKDYVKKGKGIRETYQIK